MDECKRLQLRQELEAALAVNKTASEVAKAALDAASKTADRAALAATCKAVDKAALAVLDALAANEVANAVIDAAKDA